MYVPVFVTLQVCLGFLCDDVVELKVKELEGIDLLDTATVIDHNNTDTRFIVTVEVSMQSALCVSPPPQSLFNKTVCLPDGVVPLCKAQVGRL